ncbi:hypothetical protein O9992_07475 [Vibrio lentus]|nr:hypothetical protein [Vibrio lentus]
MAWQVWRAGRLPDPICRNASKGFAILVMRLGKRLLDGLNECM